MTRNNMVDVFKYISALLVVAIHTSLFKDVDSDLYFYTVGILCRIAVPFFAICSGYYLARKYKTIDIKSKMSYIPFFNQWKKNIKLYLVWTVLYLLISIPMWIEINWFSLWSFIDFGIGTIIKGSHYHLWYLLSVIYAIPLLYLVVIKTSNKNYSLIAAILYFAKVVMYGYSTFLPNSIIKIIELANKIPAIADAIFCVLPFLLIGFSIGNKELTNKKSSEFLFLLSLIGWIIEANILKNVGAQSFSYLLFTLPTSFYFFKIVINHKSFNEQINKYKLGELSVYVYCVHPMIIESLNKIQISSILLFVIVSMTSTVIGLLIIYLKERISVK